MSKVKPTGRLAEMSEAMKTRGDKLVIPTVEQYLISKQDFNDRKPDVLHVSEMAKKDWCERASYYRIKTGRWPQEKFKFGIQNIFEEGNQIHAKWQGWLQGSGKLWGNWHCVKCGLCVFRKTADELANSEVGYIGKTEHCKWVYDEVELYHGLIYGHEDGAIGDRLIEFKSVGLGTLRHEHPELLAKHYIRAGDKKVYDIDGIWKNLKQPFRSHVRQANLYLYLAQMMGLEFEKCSIVYEFKPNQQTAEFVIRMSHEIVSPLVERAEALQTTLRRNMVPECPYGGCKACKSYEDTTTTGTTADGDASSTEVPGERRRITRAGHPLVRPASS